MHFMWRPFQTPANRARLINEHGTSRSTGVYTEVVAQPLQLIFAWIFCGFA